MFSFPQLAARPGKCSSTTAPAASTDGTRVPANPPPKPPSPWLIQPGQAQRPVPVSHKYIYIKTAVQKFAGRGGKDASPIPFPHLLPSREIQNSNSRAEQQLALCEDASAKWSEET